MSRRADQARLWPAPALVVLGLGLRLLGRWLWRWDGGRR